MVYTCTIILINAFSYEANLLNNMPRVLQWLLKLLSKSVVSIQINISVIRHVLSCSLSNFTPCEFTPEWINRQFMRCYRNYVKTWSPPCVLMRLQCQWLKVMCKNTGCSSSTDRPHGTCLNKQIYSENSSNEWDVDDGRKGHRDVVHKALNGDKFPVA